MTFIKQKEHHLSNMIDIVMLLYIHLIVTFSSTLCMVSQVQGDGIADRAYTSCRCLPGDSCWPSQGDWDDLNRTVVGGLIATVPLGSPCHGLRYDAAECSLLQTEWTNAQVQSVFLKFCHYEVCVS